MPERRCIVSHKTGEHHDMVRFVCDPSGQIIPDVAGKLPGRGAWVDADRKMLEKAVSSGKLARALDGQLPEVDLPDMVENLLLKRCQDSLAMGRRGGITLGGGGKIRAQGITFGLIIAKDASEREARAIKGDVEHDWIMDTMTSDEIGVPFGRPMAFAALINGHLRQAQQVALELLRLDRLRGGEDQTVN